MKKILSILALSTMLSCNQHEEVKSNEHQLKCHATFTGEQLLQDLDILVTTLNEVHPDLYRVSDKSLIDDRIQSIKDSLNQDRTYLEFLKFIAPLFTEIGCINTQWGHSKEYIDFRKEKIRLFPLQFEIQNDRFIITANGGFDELIKEGEEIIAINGEDVSAYLKKNYQLLPVDGNIRAIQNNWLSAFFRNHHSNFWTQPDTFDLRITTLAGDLINVDIPARLSKEILINSSENQDNYNPLHFAVGNDMAIITIETFNSQILAEHQLNMKYFLDSSFKVIRDKKIQSLMIDFRGKGWGDIEYGNLLHSYLIADSTYFLDAMKFSAQAKYTHQDHIMTMESDLVKLSKLTNKKGPLENAYSGELLILTDAWNFHSKGLFCAVISKRPNTVFYGTECGASPFGINGIPASLILPNSQIKVNIPTTQFIANQKEYNNLNSIKIDVPMKIKSRNNNEVLDLLRKKRN